MGLIVHDSYTTIAGITLSDYYVNIDDIHISKSGVDNPMYSLSVKYKSFVDKNARSTYKTPFCEMNLIITTTTLNNIGTQIYDEIKKKFENFTDDL
jgi:hypothetical protein